jgi:hypothetical protein
MSSPDLQQDISCTSIKLPTVKKRKCIKKFKKVIFSHPLTLFSGQLRSSFFLNDKENEGGY